MAFEEPQVRPDIQFGDDFSLAIGAAGVGNVVDPVEHQHGRQRKLGIARPEHIAMSAVDQFIIGEALKPVCFLSLVSVLRIVTFDEILKIIIFQRIGLEGEMLVGSEVSQ